MAVTITMENNNLNKLISSLEYIKSLKEVHEYPCTDSFGSIYTDDVPVLPKQDPINYVSDLAYQGLIFEHLLSIIQDIIFTDDAVIIHTTDDVQIRLHPNTKLAKFCAAAHDFKVKNKKPQYYPNSNNKEAAAVHE